MHSYKPFEKAVCEATGLQAELDPIHSLSIDGLASRLRSGDISLPQPWALHPEIGFETRFHSVRVCNIKFQSLHKGKTRGSMLANFSDEFSWVKNLGDRGPAQFANPWLPFLREVFEVTEAVYLPETEEDSPWTTFVGRVKINSQWFSFRPPTVAGVVVDVTDSFENETKPCDVPVSFRDCDYLYTLGLVLKLGLENLPAGFFTTICENFWKSHAHPAEFERLRIVGNDVSSVLFAKSLDLGHGLLGFWKRHATDLSAPIMNIPQLELRF